MKKVLIFLAIFSCNVIAKENPNYSGQILYEFKSDQILESSKKNIAKNNSYFNIEPDLSYNFQNGWSLKTGLRIWPMIQRNYDYPERSRSILAGYRGFNQDDSGVVVEELKAYYESDDLKFQAGKFDPSFATLYKKSKRIGVFLTDFTEDYELREKIGASISAILPESEITFNGFYNDNTPLNDSAFNGRGNILKPEGQAGNGSIPNSYSITFEGKNLFEIKNLFYNIGYRNLSVNKSTDLREDESGYSGNLEYLHKFYNGISLSPIVEYVKINNFTGRKNRDASYYTSALVAKYKGWSTSAAAIRRNIHNNYDEGHLKSNDHQFQYNVGYKFKNNLSIDVSRMRLKEDGYSAQMLGLMISYLYKF